MGMFNSKTFTDRVDTHIPCICSTRTANMIYNDYVIGTITEEQNDAGESDWVFKINWENWEKSGCIPIHDIDTNLRLDEYIFEDIPTFVRDCTQDDYGDAFYGKLAKLGLSWNDRFEYMCITHGSEGSSPIRIEKQPQSEEQIWFNYSTKDKIINIIEIIMELLNCSYTKAFNIARKSEVFEALYEGDQATLYQSAPCCVEDIGRELQSKGDKLADYFSENNINNTINKVRQRNIEKKESAYSESDRIATEFLIGIINTAMLRFNIGFEKLKSILENLGYWELFNDTDILITGAHHGMDELLKKIGDSL